MSSKAQKSRILVVDDSRCVAELLSSRLSAELGLQVDIARSIEDIRRLLQAPNVRYFVAVVDLLLPDAAEGEGVDLVLARDIPTIVLTGSVDKRLRHSFVSRNVVDYVIKKDAHTLDSIIHIVKRLQSNRQSTILIVDDSQLARLHIRRLLEPRQYTLLEAADGIEACDLIEKHPETSLVVTDYMMPNMDGVELISRLRKRYGYEDLSIIAVSSTSDDDLTARLLKAGANDFINKPYHAEELQCRVELNLEIVNLVRRIRDMAQRDYLTGLFNRRYFFEKGGAIFDAARKQNRPLVLAIIDVDHFKAVNDNYGHACGDGALVALAERLLKAFRPSDLAARLGGEEFVALLPGMPPDMARERAEALRAAVQSETIHCDEAKLHITISIGICTHLGSGLDEMLARADENLYRAKTEGRNRVVMT